MTSDPSPIIDPEAQARRERLRATRSRLWPARAAHVVRRLGWRAHPMVRAAAAERIDPALAVGAVGALIGLFAVDFIAQAGDGIHDAYGRLTMASLGGLLDHLRAQDPVWVAWTAWMLVAAGLLVRGLVRTRLRLPAPRPARAADLTPIERYLAQLDHRLRGLPAHQRREVIRELRAHLQASDERKPFTDVAAIAALFGDPRELARGIRRAKGPAVRRSAPATRAQAAGWLAVGIACLWHSALLIELGMSLTLGRAGRINWWEDPQRRVMVGVLRELQAALMRGETLAWMLFAWALLGAAMTVRGLVLLTRSDPASTPRPHAGR